MDEQCAAILRDMRNAYAYPAAFVAMRELHQDPEFVVDGAGFAFHPATAGELTSWEFDAALNAALRSIRVEERQRGVLSVLYWGWFSSRDKRARSKVSLLVTPAKPARLGIGDPKTLARLGEAAERADLNDFGGALAAVSGISQFGRTPFASKLIAFLRPESAGVYDNKISEWLAGERPLTNPALEECLFAQWKRQLLCGGIGGAKRIPIQYTYAAWCWFLQDIARQLNALGQPYQWTDSAQGTKGWRALDVERAIFGSIRKKQQAVGSVGRTRASA